MLSRTRSGLWFELCDDEDREGHVTCAVRLCLDPHCQGTVMAMDAAAANGNVVVFRHLTPVDMMDLHYWF